RPGPFPAAAPGAPPRARAGARRRRAPHPLRARGAALRTVLGSRAVEPRAARRPVPSLAPSVRAALAAAAVAMAGGPGCAPSGPAAPPLDDVAEAWFHPSADREPPADDDPLWRRVELPDFWGIGRRSRAREGWYRITFTAHPDQPWAASVEGDWSALDVFLNGRAQLHAHEQYGDLLPSEPPLLVLMPAHELEPGDNQLLLRFETALWRIGSLGPLLIGP